MEMTKYIVKHFPTIDVIAGNIATGEAAKALELVTEEEFDAWVKPENMVKPL